MNRSEATIEGALARSHDQIAAANLKFMQSKKSHSDAVFNEQVACLRQGKQQGLLERCLAERKVCEANARRNKMLASKRDKLLEQLNALDSMGKVLEDVNKIMEDRPEYPFEGVYRGVGRLSEFRVVIDDHNDGFRIRSKSINPDLLNQNTGASEHLLTSVGKAFSFCFNTDDKRTCGQAIVNNDGFEFDGIKFERIKK